MPSPRETIYCLLKIGSVRKYCNQFLLILFLLLDRPKCQAANQITLGKGGKDHDGQDHQ